MGDTEYVLSCLKGKIIQAPKTQTWMLKQDAEYADYKYTCEPGETVWTPMNSNLQMQGIQVKEYAPVPEKTLDEPGNSFGDTLLLLDMVREKTVRENRKKKDDMIRAMAMEQKQKMQQKGNSSVLYN